jgi:hypothetical protein
MTDKDIEHLVSAFLAPWPFGLTKFEREQMMNWLKHPSIFVEMAESKNPIKGKLEEI